jgi:hypothetical protein
MSWYNFWKNDEVERLNEEIKSFHNKLDGPMSQTEIKNKTGEGFEDTQLVQGYGSVGMQSFNLFYKQYINKAFESELARIYEYRNMANMSEIADVIEDAVNESTQEDHDGKIVTLEIKDEKLLQNENIVKNIQDEFEDLFYNRLDINDKLWDILRSYYIDGRVFYERIIDSAHPSNGIIGIKKLPAESMDYLINPITGEIVNFFQYLSERPKRPNTLEEARQANDIIVFDTNQISFVNYGIYGRNKYEILGYLEKAKIPYNQLKLLETSVIIYRIIRAPERFVFRIDTGAMPLDKAMKFVEKVKNKMTKKQSFDPTTGRLTQEPEVLCIRKNTEIPLLDGRYLTLEEVVKEQREGKENWVYTINQETLGIEPGRIKRAEITRLNEPLVRVWLDSGDYIDTTYDHKFILRDGSECRADNLLEGQSLMPLYKKNERIRSNVKNLYEMIYDPMKHGYVYTHNMVSTFFNGRKQRGYVDHHCDFNPFNNNPSNLRRMFFDEHSKMHGDIVRKYWKENREKMLEAVRRGKVTLLNDKEAYDKMRQKLKDNWKVNYDELKKSTKEGLDKWLSIEENQKRHSEWTTRTNVEQNKAAKMRKVLNTPEVRDKQKEAVRKHKTEWFEDSKNMERFKENKTIRMDGTFIGNVCKIFLENNRPKRDEMLSILNKNNMLVKYLKLLNRDRYPRSNFIINRNILGKVVSSLGFKDYPTFRSEYAKVLNHKVTKIEYLDERDDTGCIEVDGNHNFALSKNGKSLVFVKNSLLENFYLPQCLHTSTKIDLLDGRTLTLNEIIEEHQNGKKHEVRSIDQESGEVIRGEVEWAGITRKNAELVRVWLDNNEYIDCTPDHKFLVWVDDNKTSMIEVEAQHLTEDMELVES